MKHEELLRQHSMSSDVGILEYYGTGLGATIEL